MAALIEPPGSRKTRKGAAFMEGSRLFIGLEAQIEQHTDGTWKAASGATGFPVKGDPFKTGGSDVNQMYCYDVQTDPRPEGLSGFVIVRAKYRGPIAASFS